MLKKLMKLLKGHLGGQLFGEGRGADFFRDVPHICVQYTKQFCKSIDKHLQKKFICDFYIDPSPLENQWCWESKILVRDVSQ